MKITVLFKDSSTSETSYTGCSACNAAREVKRIMSDPEVSKITIEVENV